MVSPLRPYELADAWGADRAEVLEVMMQAAHVGLLEPGWDVICPRCMLAHESLRELAALRRVGTCMTCANTFERDLKESVELVFLPHPKVRKVERATYCLGAPALRPHVIAQQVLDPGEERRLELELPRGRYQIAAARSGTAGELVASAVGFEGTCEVTTTRERVEVRPPIVRAGAISLVLRNDSNLEETVRIEVPGARADGVCAASALTHPSFRELFSDQLLAHGEHLRVSHLAFLFVEFSARAALFEELGDARACETLTRLDALVHEAAEAHEGTIVPSALEQLVVAFPTALQALRAALALRAAVDRAELGTPVAIAAHDGRCIALTREGKPEFFGETLHRGRALTAECPAGGLSLSASFAADHEIAVALHESGMRVSVTKAQSGPYQGRRITLVTPA